MGREKDKAPEVARRPTMSPSDHLKWLTRAIGGIGLLGLLLAAVAILLGGLVDGYFHRSICFERSCLSRVYFLFKAPIVIVSGTLALLSAVATIGGIFVALQSYVTSAKATAFTNHISQLNAFLVYISGETAKRPRISPQSVDAFHWYRMIFQDAGVGELAVSDRYKRIVSGINDAIAISNSLATEASRDRFRYVDHQDRMIAAMNELGISIVRQPRLEFFEIEDQVVDMVKAVNVAFCPRPDLPYLAKRLYI